MSTATNKRPLLHLADRLFGKALMITQSKLEMILHVLGPRMGFSAEAIPILTQMPGDDDQDPDNTASNGIAVIPIRGTLVKRASGMSAFSGMTSYEALEEQLEDAITDPAVKGIILDIDSPGGEAAGMADLSDMIYNARGSKPIFAVSNDSMYSAAYGLGCAADQIYVTREGGVGSIGCYMLHVDRSKLDADMGVKYTYIYAGDKKVAGNPHEPLSDDARAEMQGECDRIRDLFVSLVARNRAVDAKKIYDTEAGCLYAEQALPLLADKVGNFDQAYNDMCALLGIPAVADPEEPDDDDEEDDNDGSTLPVGSSKPDSNTGSGGVQATAIPPHKTATSDKPWDGPANEKNLKLDQKSAYYKKAYAWYDSKADGTKKSSYKFIHHEVSSSGDIGAANIQGCRAGIGVLNGARGGTTIPAADRKGVYDHLARHLKDAGLDAPPLKSEAEIEAEVLSNLEVVPGLAVANASMLIPFYQAKARLGEDLEAVKAKYGDAVEGRLLCFPKAEASAALDSRKISMLVVPYDGSLSSNLGGFREVYQPGCFKDGLNDDPRAVFNHDYACILGRTSAGTARFLEDSQGVHVECDAPETQWADDLLVSMRRRDINQASAAFFILQHRWEVRGGERVRIVERALMREASVHAFPAYEATQASAQPAQEEVAAEQSGLEMDGARLHLLKLR